MTGSDFVAILPLLCLGGGAVAVMLGIAVKRSHCASMMLALGGLIAALIAMPWASSQAQGAPHVMGLFTVDTYGLIFQGIVCIAAIFVVLLSYGYLAQRDEQPSEYYLLILLATLGAATLAITDHFATLFLGLEILSVSLYGLIAYSRHEERCIEAALKYLVLAAGSAAFLLFGMALLYAVSGTLNFVEWGKLAAGADNPMAASPALVAVGGLLVFVGIGFKLAVVPFHMWTPDVYQGAPAPVTAFIASVSKGGVVALLLRFFFSSALLTYPGVTWALSAIAIASMVAGNFLALLQDNVKRILAYSSIAHLGYLMVAFLAAGNLGPEAATFYLIAYSVTSLGAFGVVVVLSSKEGEAESISDYQGLFQRRPALSAIFTAMLFSLAGIPLTAGFLGKWFVVNAGVDASRWGLVFVLIATSLLGVFYYLRIVVAMFRAPAEGERTEPALSYSGGFALGLLTVLLIWIGVYPEPILRLLEGVRPF